MTAEDGFVVAVDGPGGVGKSTVSRRVAQRLGARHLDTGAFYRAFTLAVLETGSDPGDELEVLEAMAGRRLDHTGGRTSLDGRDVTNAIRSDRVTAAVSTVSAHPGVRRRLVALQRRWVGRWGGGVVVEGRDIGSVVFPDAEVKVYLDADPEVRAARRSEETGGAAAAVAAALQERDRLDTTRTTSPLLVAPDALVIDTTHLEIDAVVNRILDLCEGVFSSG